MPDGLLGVLRHQGLELALGPLVVEKGLAGVAEQAGELRPGIRRAHIDDADGLDAWPRRLDIEQARRLAGLDAAPEFLLRGHQDGAGRADRHGIVISTHLPPPVMIESTAALALVTHILCWSWAMCFSAAAFFGERPGQHELGLEHRPAALDDAVQGRRHPADHRMLSRSGRIRLFARYCARTSAD